MNYNIIIISESSSIYFYIHLPRYSETTKIRSKVKTQFTFYWKRCNYKLVLSKTFWIASVITLEKMWTTLWALWLDSPVSSRHFPVQKSTVDLAKIPCHQECPYAYLKAIWLSHGTSWALSESFLIIILLSQRKMLRFLLI